MTDTDRHARRRAAKWAAALAALAVLALLGAGIWTHFARHATAEATLRDRRQAVPRVRVMRAEALDGALTVDLPGTMQAFDSAVLYARATGYVATRRVDIGSRVRKGDVLAVIAAPDLDQQLAQARAQLVQMQAALVGARADLQLANVTNKRTARLVEEGWNSRQQGDSVKSNATARAAAVGSAQADIMAQRARVDQLVELTGYERVTAPFGGVITARQIDVGSLVTANAANASPLFSIARNDTLRVQVYVPQEYVFGFRDGQDAGITVPQLPGRVFHGTVSRNARALGSTTRTLLAEVDIDNRDGLLSPGLYCIVHLHVPRPHPVVSLPTEAVMFGRDGLRAAVLQDGAIRLRDLDLQQDDGAKVEVRNGIAPGDMVVLNPPVNVADGMRAQAEPEDGKKTLEKPDAK